MPRLASGPATRTHGVRPSEKIASRVISSTSPQGHPSSDCPPLEGRALHARMGGYAFTGGSPPGPPGVRSPFDDHALSRVRVRPCNADVQSASLRENHLSLRLRFFPARPPHLGSPPGGAGSARPHENALASPWYAPARPPASRQHVRNHDVPRLAPSLRSRTRRAHPSEKITLRVVPGLPPEAIVARILYPRRGGLRTPA